MKRKTSQITVGNVKIGGGAPVSIQSMTNTLTTDVDKIIKQIHELEEHGCEIVRVAVPDADSVKALKEIKKNISIPLVADIHYDYKLAVEAASVADKIRINPGNIGGNEKVKSVVKAAKDAGIPIRIGVNLGSLEKDLEKKYGLTPEAMAESALRAAKFIESLDFTNIIFSLKASDVPRTIKAYKLFADRTYYPLHLGISEAGSFFSGGIKSAVGIGSLLLDGIGDTIRVSLSGDPVEEVKVAKQILSSVGLRKFGVSVTSCPTCARAEFDVAKVAEEIENKTALIKKPLHIAIMGCSVNGPGEAKEADIGIVGGKGGNLFYKKGKIAEKVDDDKIIEKIMEEINNQ